MAAVLFGHFQDVTADGTEGNVLQGILQPNRRLHVALLHRVVRATANDRDHCAPDDETTEATHHQEDGRHTNDLPATDDTVRNYDRKLLQYERVRDALFRYEAAEKITERGQTISARRHRGRWGILSKATELRRRTGARA